MITIFHLLIQLLLNKVPKLPLRFFKSNFNFKFKSSFLKKKLFDCLNSVYLLVFL